MRKKSFQYFLMMTFCVVLATVAIPTQAIAQRDRSRYEDRNRDDDRNYQQRYTKSQVSEIIKRVEETSNRFREDLDRDLDRGRLDGSKREDKINEDVKTFENAFNNLRREFDRNDSWWESRNNVQTALDSARPVATRLRNNQFSSNVQTQWANLRTELNKLASTYNLPPENDTSYENRIWNNDRNRYEDRNGNNDGYSYENRKYQQRYSKSQVSEIIKRVGESSNRFRRDLDRDLDGSRLDGSRREDQINEEVRAFENAFNNLRREFNNNNSWWESRNNVQTALESARPIETRLRNNRFGSSVQNQWRNLRIGLNRLASAYNLPQM